MNAGSKRPAADAGSPGATIRGLRLGKGLTLAKVSERTGLAVSTLSKLEKGSASLSYDKLMLISGGLGVDIASLVNPKSQVTRSPMLGVGRRVVQRTGEGHFVETQSYRQLYLATELLNKKMTTLIAEIRASTLDEFMAEFGDLIRHPGEEFTLVLEGELDFHTELYASLRLRAGDSVYFDSEMGYAYIKATDEACRTVCSCWPRGGDDAMTAIFVNASKRLDAEGVTSPPRAMTRRARKTVP